MNYRPTFVPVGDDRVSTIAVRDTTGALKQPIVAGQVTEAQATSFVSGNNATVAKAAIANTVQPSTAQLAGLLAYLALIQVGSSTTAVETALGL